MIKISSADYKSLSLKSGKKLAKNLRKVNKGYPIQYLIGNVNFFGYEIKVNKNVLIPRFETEQLVEEVLKLLDKSKNLNILDLGTGSGCISIALKKELPKAKITALDNSFRALKIAKENAELNNVDIKFIHQNIKKVVDNKFDLIISNPPYISKDEKIMPSVRKYEPNKALFARNKGLFYYQVILENYHNRLNKNGIIALEIGCYQKEAILKIINSYCENWRILCQKDYSLKDRFIFIVNR
ncbi:MAG TPA: peptide chain release factor N(5)-glutamine methyltransferase [Bacilli bacterium]|nr:peptide chain release factor N(5)-glutamine methyltransferase [Bacilli bacterium]